MNLEIPDLVDSKYFVSKQVDIYSFHGSKIASYSATDLQVLYLENDMVQIRSEAKGFDALMNNNSLTFIESVKVSEKRRMY